MCGSPGIKEPALVYVDRSAYDRLTFRCLKILRFLYGCSEALRRSRNGDQSMRNVLPLLLVFFAVACEPLSINESGHYDIEE